MTAPREVSGAQKAMLTALAFIRWTYFGECRTVGWDGPLPSGAEAAGLLEPALAAGAAPEGEAVACYRLQTGNSSKWQWMDGEPSLGTRDLAAFNGWKIEYAYTRPQPAPAGDPPVVDEAAAYKAGWTQCAKWADRDDLISDIDSPAYEADRVTALSPPSEPK